MQLNLWEVVPHVLVERKRILRCLISFVVIIQGRRIRVPIRVLDFLLFDDDCILI